MAEDLQDWVNVHTGLQILVCSQTGDEEPLKKYTSRTKKGKKTKAKPNSNNNKQPLPLNQIIQQVLICCEPMPLQEM